jgi:translation initiation factor 3 subunit L
LLYSNLLYFIITVSHFFYFCNFLPHFPSPQYFASSPWPSPQAIASECNGHPLFLAIYREVTHRHWHSVSRPSVRDRLEGWSVYKEVLDELLDDDTVSAQQRQSPFYLLPDWTFDMLHEFVYQFQGFCQFRATTYAAAKKHGVPLDGTTGSTSSSNVPHHLMENLSQLHLHKDAWAVETVMYYLHRLMAVGKTSKFPGYQYLGIFASVALSRLECLLGDHAGCLQAASAMVDISVTDGEETKTATEVIQSVVGARLSHAYHCAVAYLMLRRYQMAISTLGAACSYLQRGFKTGQLATRKSQNQGDGGGGAQYSKLYDRMVALLAILTHICPPRNQLEESLMRSIREKHGSQLAKMDDTTPATTPPRNVYQDLFCFASPKFISPTATVDVYKLQVRQFNAQMGAQQESRKLRSYMKLYTSIDLTKLAAFYDDSNPAAFTSLLLSYKHQMLQEEEDGEKKSALDIHYHLLGNMVNVDEAEKQRRFENYFMAQIRQNDDIAKNVEQISTVV